MSQPDRLQNITVQLAERSYPIWIGKDLLGNAHKYLMECISKLSHAVVFADANAAQALYPVLLASLSKLNIRVSFFEVPSGEKSKSISEIEKLWEFMSAEHSDRGSVVIALGGGVVGDLAGFAAATFARGLKFIQIPTTLLSQVDSSVGGKTGINLSQAKNMVGSFWQPSLVLIDLNSLATLPDREFSAGLAEVVKYGMILDAVFFEWLENNIVTVLRKDPAALTHVIRRSCELKAQVVSADERETTGLRAVLNYGHTFGHALESLSGYGTLLHGEAVSIGMTMAARLAVHLDLIPGDILSRQTELLRRCNLPVKSPSIALDTLWQSMQKDKKVQYGKLTFILPTEIGNVRGVEGVTFQQVSEALQGF
ncbi:MAG: 3-dehydroquinate synthase [Planctomycetota bacterium]|jgi:3-dehydroquinate synthase